MVNPWALALPLLLLVIVAVRWSTPPSRDTVFVANTMRGRLLPRYQSRLRRLRVAGALSFGVLATVAVASSVLVARPHSGEMWDEELASRDIVLCLDVSGSVFGFGSEVMEAFADMVEEFQGERVSLIIWNSNSRVVFPLTDDYELIRATLLEGAQALRAVPYTDAPADPEAFYSFTAGTFITSTGGASLVGDGLVNCALQFDRPEEERSRSVILATDNEVATPEAQIYTLPEAVRFADERGVMMHGMYIQTYYGVDNDDARQLQSEMEAAGGYYLVAGDRQAAAELLEQIQAQQAVALEADPVMIALDNPGSWPILATAGVGLLLVLGWRFRL
ncbi:vWA domain-containing protein [Flaviflexus huanghaiensis]|uniref:vWA domain-containing protein n=1 Tax=Flaviflexus huanghaiensis TaxID=1111473 RepID=UPI0015F9E216|nr:VWA domain-containing protein [Flaviflexus huanghaiensis]